MGTRLHWVGWVIVVLALTACSADYGVDQFGRKVPAARLEGQWLIVNYWADWCGPCRKEVPELNILAQQLQHSGARVLGVNYDGLREGELSKAVNLLGIQYTVLADDPAARFELTRSEVLPVTYIIDATGRLRERLPGEQTAAGLKARLAALQKEVN